MRKHSITFESIGTVLVVRLYGDLNISNTNDVMETIQKNVSGAERIIVDLSAIDYINSTAIGALINFRMGSDCIVELVIPRASSFWIIIENLSLGKFFKIHNSLETALKNE